MLRLSLALLLGAGMALGMAGQANAAKRSKSDIVLQGCTYYRVPACTMIRSRGQTYSLVGASPAVPLNAGVTVTGTKSGDWGICFAPTIKVVKWSRNRMRCPAS